MDDDEKFMNITYESENISTEDAINTVLKNYDRFVKLAIKGKKYPKENNLFQFISSKFPNNSFDAIVQDKASEKYKDKFFTKGSKRQNYCPTTPFLSIVYSSQGKKNLSTSKYFCIAYIFQVDMEGVYLTFSIGTTPIKLRFLINFFAYCYNS